MAGRTVSPVRVAERLKARFQRFMERPGTTVDLRPLWKLLPAVEEAEEGLSELTDEGKTLAAAIAAFGFSLRGEPIHVLTVNDYLARRDAEWMAPVYERLGLTVGWVTELSTPEERRAAYACDVTYVSVSEAGYDYLRDCLVVDVADTVQRDLGVVIVDEADSILIDEARVPLVVAGAIAGKANPVEIATALVRHVRPWRDYHVAEDGRSVQLTATGLALVERELGGVNLYEPDQVETLTAINVALYARALVRRDVDYIVRGGKVELVDEFRGRVAHRRRGRGARHDHGTGADPALPHAMRNDRHGRARRRRASRVLRPRGRRDRPQHPVHPRRRAGPGLRQPRGEGRGADRRDRGRARHAAPGPDRHARRGRVRAARRRVAGRRHPVRGAQREERRR